MHAISSYRGNRPINTQTDTLTHTNPQTGPIIIHCTAASAQCNYQLAETVRVPEHAVVTFSAQHQVASQTWPRRLCYYLRLFVCLFVRLSAEYVKTLWTNYIEIFGEVIRF